MMSVDKDKARPSNAVTDQESGDEGLSAAVDAEKSLKALEEMYKRGLVPIEVYERRKKDILKTCG